MGILDDLKKKAESLSLTKAEDDARQRENAELVERALAKAFRYLDEFAKHMQIIRPPSGRSFVLEGVGSFDGLTLTEFFADYRKKKFEDKDYFDYVSFRYRHVAEKTLTVKKDAELVERCMDALWRCNLKYRSKELKNERGYVVQAIFTIPVDVPATLTVDGDYDGARLIFTLKNVERFETLKLGYRTSEVDDALLDQLAKLILGEPNRFRAGGELLL